MDAVNYNGTLIPLDQWVVAPDRLLGQTYIYQHIHTYRHRALHLETHLELLCHAVKRIFGRTFRLSSNQLQREIGDLLLANRYPEGSNRVTLRFFPFGIEGHDGYGDPVYLLEATAQLFYPRYTLGHTRPLLAVFPCDHAWEGYPTAVSLLSASFGRQAATQQGAELAVLENRNGILTHIDDEPLFLLFGDEVVTTPLHDGATDSVMRRLLVRACQEQGITLTEYPLTRDLLTRCDEAFTVSVQGVISLLGYGSYRYFNLTALKLCERINTINLT